MQGTLELVVKAKEGDELALRDLMKIVREHHMPRYVGGYRGKNVLVGDDDIESEFLFGVFKALGKARLDVGNPINFMCWKGQKAVQSLFRQRIRSEVKYQCLECGDVDLLGWRDKVPTCKACLSKDVWTWMVAHADQSPTETINTSLIHNAQGMSAEHAWELAVHGVQIEEIRARLSGRALELFDILIFEGINRDGSRNYLEEVANRWGVTTTAVAAALRKLRRDISAYIEA